MKKMLVTLLFGGFCGLVAAESIWEYDLDGGTAKRTVGDKVTEFKVTRERSADSVEALPEEADEDTWYPIFRKGILNLSSDDEEIKDHPFQQLVSELKFIIVEGRKTFQTHFGQPYEKVSQWKKKTFYKCWVCEEVELLARLLKRVAGSAEETVASESVAGSRHDRKNNLDKDFTNPIVQGFTPAPDGVGGVNKQVLENTIKSFGKRFN